MSTKQYYDGADERIAREQGRRATATDLKRRRWCYRCRAMRSVIRLEDGVPIWDGDLVDWQWRCGPCDWAAETTA